MSEASFITHFINAADFRNPVAVTMDTPLCALPEWDSLAALGVIVMFDMEYGKAISGEDLHCAKTVGDLYRLVS